MSAETKRIGLKFETVEAPPDGGEKVGKGLCVTIDLSTHAAKKNFFKLRWLTAYPRPSVLTNQSVFHQLYKLENFDGARFNKK